MKILPLQISALLLALSVSGSANQNGQQPAQTPSNAPGLAVPAAKISGRVLRTDGRPLPKASVALEPLARSSFSDIITLRVDGRGQFEFADVAPGRYRIVARRNGYVAQTHGQRGGGPGVPIQVNAGQTVGGIEFRLERAGVVSGTVLDEDNDPAEGVEVRAHRVRFSPGGRQTISTHRTARTDDLGNYRLSGLAPGFYYVQAGGRESVGIGGPVSGFSYVPTYYPGVTSREEARRVQVTSGGETRGTDILVRTTPTFTIHGLIVDASPSGGPRKYDAGFGKSSGFAFLRVDRTDGTFTLRGNEPGEYTVMGQVSEEGKRPRRGYRKIKIVDAEVKVVVEVGQSAEVQGQGRVDDNTPFSFTGISVELRPEDDTAILSNSTIDEDGKFRVRDLSEGEYNVEVSGRQDELFLKQFLCAGED